MDLQGIVLNRKSGPDALHQVDFSDHPTRGQRKGFQDIESSTAERDRSAQGAQLPFLEIKLPSGVLEAANLNLSQCQPILSVSNRSDKTIEGEIEPTIVPQPAGEYFSFFQVLSRHLSRSRRAVRLKRPQKLFYQNVYLKSCIATART